jgi:hypothetical protein
MAESFRNEMNRRPGIESMRGMSMAKPMRRNIFTDSSPESGFSDDSPSLRNGELRMLLRSKDRGIDIIHSIRSHFKEVTPKIFRNQDGSSLPAFAEERNLSAYVARL